MLGAGVRMINKTALVPVSKELVIWRMTNNIFKLIASEAIAQTMIDYSNEP